MEDILFTIIVPIYNVAEFLPQCLESIHRQTYRNFEVILVDDGSKDTSGDICDNYVSRDKRFKVIHKENGGLVSARQAGIAAAKGRYIACVDGDDWISLDYLSVFEAEVRDDYPDIVCCGYFNVNEKGKIRRALPNRKGNYDRREIEEEIFPMLIQTKQAQYFPPTLWAKIFKRDLYKHEQQQVDVTINNGEDGACTIPCIFYAKSMSVLSACMYYYRNNPLSITKNGKPFIWDGPRLIAQHLERQVDMSVGDFQEQLYRKIVHELFSVIITQFYRDEPKKVIENDIKSHLEKPYYANAIRRCHFGGSVKAQIMYFSIRYRAFWLMRLYAHIRNNDRKKLEC